MKYTVIFGVLVHLVLSSGRTVFPVRCFSILLSSLAKIWYIVLPTTALTIAESQKINLFIVYQTKYG